MNQSAREAFKQRKHELAHSESYTCKHCGLPTGYWPSNEICTGQAARAEALREAAAIAEFRTRNWKNDTPEHWEARAIEESILAKLPEAEPAAQQVTSAPAEQQLRELREAESRGMLAAAKLICVRCRRDEPIVVNENETTAYHGKRNAPCLAWKIRREHFLNALVEKYGERGNG